MCGLAIDLAGCGEEDLCYCPWCGCCPSGLGVKPDDLNLHAGLLRRKLDWHASGEQELARVDLEFVHEALTRRVFADVREGVA